MFDETRFMKTTPTGYRNPKYVAQLEGWLNPPQATPQEQRLRKILEKKEDNLLDFSFFMKERLEQALQLKIQDIQAGRAPKYFEQYLKEVWKPEGTVDQDGAIGFSLKGSGLDLEWYGDGDTFTISGADASYFETTMSLLRMNFARLDEVDDDIEKLKTNFFITLLDTFHEAEHIYFPGASFEPETQENIKAEKSPNLVTYFSHPCEMRAYAKEYAYAYVNQFQREPFEYEKFKAFITDLDLYPGARNYFIIFLDPVRQKKYADIADLQYIHDQMVLLVQKFVTEMQAYEIPKFDDTFDKYPEVK